MKAEKVELVKATKGVKEANWKKFCDRVKHHSWGKTYKQIMGKLTKNQSIPGHWDEDCKL